MPRGRENLLVGREKICKEFVKRKETLKLTTDKQDKKDYTKILKNPLYPVYLWL